ncbi:MAG: Fic family protein [Egibacteraceae bacterium]
MDPNRFTSPAMGRVVRTPGPHGFYTFVPEPIPRRPALDARTVMLLSEADLALGRLAGAGRLLPNPHILVSPYVTREALSSTRIEGTQASLSDIFDANARGVRDTVDIKEVTNYIRALELGLRLLPELPLSLRLVCQVHAQILEGVRGADRLPGEVRRSPNWIGSPDNKPETAIFVPPPVDEMKDALSDWQEFIHEDIDCPALIKAALLHYQFETIHPFLDGNGRLGRLLIILFLVEQDVLPQPLLYMSSYFEARKGEYYDRLQAVRERGELAEWMQFFLHGVAVQATDAVERAERLADLRQLYREKLQGSRSRAGEVVDLLFENPIATAKFVAERLGITAQGAHLLLQQLQDLDVLVEWHRVPGRAKRWLASGIMEVLDGTTDPPHR